MLAIARALMSRPKLLLLDEPSLGLAPLIVKQIFAVIADLNKREGLTVFLVEQNAYHALKLAHRGYVMVNGAIKLGGHGTRAARQPGGSRSLSRRRAPLGDRRPCRCCSRAATKASGSIMLVTVALGGSRVERQRLGDRLDLALAVAAPRRRAAARLRGALFPLRAVRRAAVVAAPLPPRLRRSAPVRRLRLSTDARAPDGRAVSVGLRAGRTSLVAPQARLGSWSQG